VASGALQPRAAQHQQVEVAVAVVVGLHEARAAERAFEPGRGDAVTVAAVRVADEIPQRRRRVGARHDHLRDVVAVEVVDHHAAGEVARVEAELLRDVGEARERHPGLEALGRDQVRGGDRVRVVADGHRGDVQQPARGQVLRVVREDAREVCECAPRAVLVLVDAAGADRQDAALARVQRDAVAALAEAQVRDREVEAR
jgi:hypothetical protein